MSSFYEKAWSERVESESRALAAAQRETRPSSVSQRSTSRTAESLPMAIGRTLAASTAASRSHPTTAVGTNRSSAANDSASVASTVARHQRHTAEWIATYLPPTATAGSSLHYRSDAPPAPSVKSTSVFSVTTLPSRTASLGLSVSSTTRNRINQYESALKENTSKMQQYEDEMRALRQQIEELREIAKANNSSSSTALKSSTKAI